MLPFFSTSRVCVAPQDAPARRSLRRPRGVPAAAAEPQRAGERRRPRGQDATDDGRARRAPGRRG